ncbi:MAG: TOBE domain-containing protein [Candidatus Kapabacteria bacterium]|nr:TOBE domain-containing protein [Candidatus Kapabacteria bacterium]
MNRLTGYITEIQSNEQISLVKVKAEDLIFTSIVLDTMETSDYLKIGNKCSIYFKETEVIISKDLTPDISIRNRIICFIKSIKHGQLLSQVNLKFANSEISSIITTSACKELNLQPDDHVLALIKTNEVSLSTND